MGTMWCLQEARLDSLADGAGGAEALVLTGFFW